MPDYQKMYAILCGAISDALDKTPVTPETALVRMILQEAVERTEELYITSGE